jgi:hypothetical protein
MSLTLAIALVKTLRDPLWRLTEMRIEEPDGIRTDLVEVPADTRCAAIRDPDHRPPNLSIVPCTAKSVVGRPGETMRLQPPGELK